MIMKKEGEQQEKKKKKYRIDENYEVDQADLDPDQDNRYTIDLITTTRSRPVSDFALLHHDILILRFILPRKNYNTVNY